ncbi:LysR family transcriptional regulator [Pseudomonas sp. H3(2019)]|uniref:LysR family transcriptional regulator n=1 Tax=Pseudomonas sp. H3(2019) TaxID=2598724 RepID=UPI0015B71F16|nr:LysR family transcriptional regulator [Pseudomonas sp. H3(2019)]
MELYQLKAFIAVAQCGSLTKAADQLFLSVPAVSAQNRALEDELDLQLFDRNSRGMLLTPLGRTLLGEAEHTVNAAKRYKTVASDSRGQLTGSLRVGTLSDSVPLRTSNTLLGLGQRHPHIAVTLHQDVSGRVIQRVRANELDCGFALADSMPEGLSAYHLTAIELAVALPANLASAAHDLELSDLARLPWIVSVPDCALHDAALDLFRSLGGVPPSQYVADSDGGLRSMIGGGLGVGMLRMSEIQAGLQAGELAVWPHWKGATWLYWIQPKEGAAPAVLALRDIVLETWNAGHGIDSVI